MARGWPVGLVLASVACSDGSGGFRFEKHSIDPLFRSEGVTVFDVNRDGINDIVTEELWYQGPDFAPHEIRTPRSWDPTTEYAHCFGTFHQDIDGDGYEDLIVFGPPGEDASWCTNPGGEDRHWECHRITDHASGESPLLADLFFSGEQLLVTGIEPERVLGWMTPGREVTDPWEMHAVTEPGFPQAARYEHGLGVGDLNRDLRLDIVTGSGWLEQPADQDTLWTWHPTVICPNNCSNMFVYDLNGDGLQDIVGASPHGYGTWWWEQRPSAGSPEFTRHVIDDTISEMHAARFVDLDGDRVPELVTGKRWFAHFTADPGALEPAYLVVYAMERSADGVQWTRHEIDDDSGVGTQFEVADVSGDGKLDIVVSNKKGLSYFEQR